MSTVITMTALSEAEKKQIENTLVVTLKNGRLQSMFTFDRTNVHLPFHFGLQYASGASNAHAVQFCSGAGFVGNMRADQLEVQEEVLSALKQNRACIVGARPGFGKTILSVDLVCKLRLKTVIIVKQVLVTTQWLKAFKEYAPTKKVQKVASLDALDEEADVYVLNPILFKSATKRTLLARCPLLIADEMHLLMTEVLIRALFHLHPAFMVGLSATPRRPKQDDFQKTIGWFFGPSIIERKLFRLHHVHVVNTGYKPELLKTTPQGLDWNHVLTDQAENENRNKLIVQSVVQCNQWAASTQPELPSRIWLILVKRVAHATSLQALFARFAVTADLLVGAQKDFNRDCTVLIGTTAKIGVGFDFAPINSLCIAADVVEYFEQFLGRCMRTETVVPVVLDFDDSLPTLHKHFLIRLGEYKKYGGKLVRQKS